MVNHARHEPASGARAARWRAARAISIALLIALPWSAFAEAPAVPPPAGIQNFHKVDANVYRGAQPTPDGLRILARLGIRTVIDLRLPREGADLEAKTVSDLGLHYVHIPLNGFEAPSNANVVKALGIMEDSSQGPVFIHCRRGADRTGTVVACYRIEHDGWANRKALAEARGLGMYWYEVAMRRYVLSFVPNAIRAEPAGRPLAPAATIEAPKPGVDAPPPDAH